MHFSRDAPGRHETLPAWPSGVCPAGAAPSPPRQGRGKARPPAPAQGHGSATHEVPGNPRFQVPMGTAELEIPGHNGATQVRCNWDLAELPPGGPCFRLDGVSPSWARVPTPLQLPHKQASGPRWPAQGAEQTSSRLQIRTERLGRGEQTPTLLPPPRSGSWGATGSTPCTSLAWFYSSLYGALFSSAVKTTSGRFRAIQSQHCHAIVCILH